MRSVLVIMLICIMIVLAFSEVWLPKLIEWDQGVIATSGTAPTTPASR